MREECKNIEHFLALEPYIYRIFLVVNGSTKHYNNTTHSSCLRKMLVVFYKKSW
jgi:hypothetical protein